MIRPPFRALFLLLGGISFLFLTWGRPLAAATREGESESEGKIREALHGVEKINDFEAGKEISDLISGYFKLPSKPGIGTIQDLFEKEGLALWSGSLAEFLGLADILFEGLPPGRQERDRLDYARFKKTLVDFQNRIIQYVLAIHPGLAFLEMDELSSRYKGKGIRVAVFDVFDPDLLRRQKEIYPRATFRDPLKFGNPVSMTHGNTVIDILLRLAPELEIIPIWSDAKSYLKAITAINQDPSIDFLNMSRALPEDPQTRALDLAFKRELRKFTRDRVFIKSLGNTGTDLEGLVSRRRRERGLGPVHNIASYDLKLIRNLYSEPEGVPGETGETPLELFALNLSLFAEDIALSATIPGSFLPVQQRTLGVPAEGVYSPSTHAFESGSSFAAPQVTGLLSLLLQARRSRYPQESRRAGRVEVYQQILRSAKGLGHGPEEGGRGLISGKVAD